MPTRRHHPPIAHSATAPQHAADVGEIRTVLDAATYHAALDRATRDGYALPDLLRVLVYRYAHGLDASGGGRKRAANMTPEQRQQAARHAATARWAKGRRPPAVAAAAAAPRPRVSLAAFSEEE